MLRARIVSAVTLAAVASACPGQLPDEQERFDQGVQQAISRAAGHLWSLQQPDGSWPAYRSGSSSYPMGPTALAAYALLESGVSPQDERMAKAIEWLARFDPNEAPRTYSVALRCQVWLIVNRKMKNKYLKEFEADVARLVKSTRDGSYNYYCFGDGNSRGDHSNSQFGVLGAWAGARANLENIPEEYWWKVMKHWLDTQCLDGGWQYQPIATATSKASMTAAGVASVFVCFDNLFYEAFRNCNVADRLEVKAIQRGLDWLDRNFDETVPNAACYYLYALERVGLASGYKYFGKADWYKVGAEQLLRRQTGGGAWGSMPDTCFAMLFLIRGRHPVLFNKLQFEGDWNNRPRALASLTGWISYMLEETVNWQIINLKVPVSEWHDAPIVYLSGARAPRFSEEELDKLRQYVWQGGTLFSLTECAGAEFRTGIRQVYAKLFPQYELVELPPEHPIYSIHGRLRGRPKFHAVSNGVRPLAIHTDEDLALRWQGKRQDTEPWAFEGAASLFLYVTDKGSLRARGVGLWPAEPAPPPPAGGLKLARLQYPGNWDPEPLAYERFARLLAKEGIGLEVLPSVAISDLPASGAKLAGLTGTGELKLPEADQQALKKFMQAGGTLVVDAAGGDRKFADSAELLLLEVFGRDSLRRLAPTAKLYSLPGKEVGEFKYRRATRERIGTDRLPWLKAVLEQDRPTVLFSREDLTAALVGYASYDCDGYDPQTAYRILRNAVLLSGGSGAAP